MRRLTDFVQRLLDGRRPRPFVPTDDETAALRAAIVLKSSAAEPAVPRAQFVADLRERLADRAAGLEPPPRLKRRRALLAGAGAAAAAATAAVVVDRTLIGGPPGLSALSPNDGVWHPVLAADALAEGEAVAFDTGVVSGFVSRAAGRVLARSGICTHQFCRLRLNQPERRLDCPCHRTAFGYDGTVLRSQLSPPPGRLPLIEAREAGGQIEVFVPRSS
ncbi:ubiquinol-cytochrome c reductase iron-sulfur subunit [Dactylosporangium matsuzakiense]|uniref:(2Fe-2S) ferredoxin n=1 Tax=Dactylosporangium matsuzakiense TaxID=53360 RepID=A0A9W6NRY6_9ACTN|nr:Rieske (2Fe-2S) protein [Dactylosporangium matsuzakiense]UWZ49186.1 Rieske 2Fe-2S domain-containing protein [Dactylosporangium matsuzakiense]GLL06746.1 (2Fe-2S) ferredoxin [Dactylosporangium matsuzakiense]